MALSLSTCAPGLQIDRSGDPEELRNCPARGGRIEGRGLFGIRTCVTAYADAGRVCTDSGECAGRCLLSYGTSGISIETHPAGREAAGRCERDDRTFGCFAEIRGGRITQPICVD